MKNTLHKLLPALCAGMLSLSAQAQIITTYAGNGINGDGGDGGQATSAQVSNPTGVAADDSGNLYIADGDFSVIRKVSAAGVITTVAGNGAYGFSGDGGQATQAKLNRPQGIAVDHSGNLYIADLGNNCIRKVSAAGIITTIAGSGSTFGGYSGDNGAATQAKLSFPDGVAVDDSGNLYIADKVNYRIRKINSAGIITTIAGNGTTGYSGDNGAATSAQLNLPYDVAIGADGSLYIADFSNHCIRKVDASGTITTVAGSNTPGYSGDGNMATTAQLNYPTGVTLDHSGNLYIADQSNNAIRRVTPAGIISTVAGTGNSDYSGDGGPATSAQLHLTNTSSQSAHVCVNDSGDLYIADVSNRRVREVSCITMPYAGTLAGADSICLNDLAALVTSRPGGVWSSANGNASVSATGVVTGLAVGTANLTYKITDNCSSDSVTKTIIVYDCATDVSNVATQAVLIYPNPAQSTLYISAPQSVSITLTDITGKELKHTANATTISISDLAEGIYIAIITDQQGNTLKKSKVVKTK